MGVLVVSIYKRDNQDGRNSNQRHDHGRRWLEEGPGRGKDVDGLHLGGDLNLPLDHNRHTSRRQWMGLGSLYVVLNIVCGGSTMNSLCNLKNLLRGKESIVHFALNMFFQVLGGIAAYQLADHIGFAAPAVPAHGLTFAGIASAEWHKFFFGREFWGIFLFYMFNKKASNDSGMPASIWSILIMATAFMIAGANFVFVPARLFDGFAAFAEAGVWCCFLAQAWAVLAAEVAGDYIWKKMY